MFQSHLYVGFLLLQALSREEPFQAFALRLWQLSTKNKTRSCGSQLAHCRFILLWNYFPDVNNQLSIQRTQFTSVFVKMISISDFCFMKGNDDTEHRRTWRGTWEGADHFTKLVSYIMYVHRTGCHKGCDLRVLSMSNESNNAAKPCRMTRLQKPFQSIWFSLFTWMSFRFILFFFFKLCVLSLNEVTLQNGVKFLSVSRQFMHNVILSYNFDHF